MSIERVKINLHKPFKNYFDRRDEDYTNLLYHISKCKHLRELEVSNEEDDSTPLSWSNI